MANLFTYLDGVVHRNESVLKNIFKRGYEEIRERKLLEILKKDRTWLKYELHRNVKMLAPLFFQNNLTCDSKVNKCLPANRFCSNIFFAHKS